MTVSEKRVNINKLTVFTPSSLLGVSFRFLKNYSFDAYRIEVQIVVDVLGRRFSNSWLSENKASMFLVFLSYSRCTVVALSL